MLLGVSVVIANHRKDTNLASRHESGNNQSVSNYDSCSGSLPIEGLVASCPKQSESVSQQSETTATPQGISLPSTSRTTSSSNTYTPYSPYAYNPTSPYSSQCNQNLKQSAANYRDSSIAYENSLHNSWTTGIPADSSYYADAKAKEDARHQAALAKIEQQYQQDLAQANCS